MDLRDALTMARDYLTAQIAALEPPPPVVVEVHDSAELGEALRTRAPRIYLHPWRYLGNVLLDYPVELTGSREAVIEPVDLFAPTLYITSSDVRVSGITVVNGLPDRECIVVGDVYATDAVTQPSRVTLDNLAVTAGPQGGHRAIALHGSDLTVRLCDITGWWETGRDSQGIWINNGPGPYAITDNLIEASGENILTGGADPRIPNCVPSDILIVRNRLRKPLSFAAADNKNALELKNARRVLIQDNIIENELPDLLHDALIQFTPRNQDGNAPWCCVEDVVLERTVLKTAAPGFAVNILGTDNEQVSGWAKNITLRGNLFQTTKGIQVLGGMDGALVLEHNTLPRIDLKLFSFDRLSARMPALTFTDNVAVGGLYDITGDGNQAFGLPSLLAFVTLAQWERNLIESWEGRAYPAGQTTVGRGELAALLDPVTFKALQGTAGY
jgi:hypothetical protein